MKKKEQLNQFNPVYAVDLLGKAKDLRVWQEQKKKLPRNIRYGLISLEAEGLIKKISEKYNLKTPEKVGSVSVLIREFLAGLLNEGELKKEIVRRFQFNNSLSLEFFKEIQTIIEKIKQIGIQEVKKDLIVSTFKKILEKFPEIKKQEIGVHLIMFPGEKIKKTPTIENWIKDYKLRKNSQQQTTILNISDYLYNSENAQALEEKEKQQLSIVLNSYEKNKTIYYNKLFEEIDFEIIKLLDKNKEPDSAVNITGFKSKPYYEIDDQKEKKKESKTTPKATKNTREKFSEMNWQKNKETKNVLDLSSN